MFIFRLIFWFILTRLFTFSLKPLDLKQALRTIIALKKGKDVFCIYGFAKNAKSNISVKEQKILKAYAKIYFSYDAEQLALVVKKKELVVV